MSRRTRPFWVAAGVVVVLLGYASFARSRSIHVSDIVGKSTTDGYVIRCCIINPHPRETRISARFSVLAPVPGTEDAVFAPLAEKRLNLMINANEKRVVDVTLDFTGGADDSFVPHDGLPKTSLALPGRPRDESFSTIHPLVQTPLGRSTEMLRNLPA